MGDKLIDGAEVLFRQVHPRFYENGVPSSQPFKPTDKDQNLLSVDRSSIVSAEDAHVNYVNGGFQSSAVFGLTVAEFGYEAIDCHSSPLDGTNGVPKNPAHSHADYSPHTSSRQKNIAKRLKIRALARGQLHPPK
ncbi:hypothetical protein OCA5_c18940 [Afipia carboxidovorans OM5]|uniref:Uncharacterized protein n=1 Tax=Afipia carboxidovorans (strain ATCC 49405 / DSM 1227 / KCTC 32145 / OM5) TaxID=504832 RepID=F8BUF4_AFIC5|nr:hypothetical protein [Afipia carboxidovorans]AEI03030.1 hypothetical protein OCA4_c18930 [Afipia carboxidovorans OM4]AEI06607.1 hypothetical protein OCA5_c18940 [Afipia carboxidovorans OM5]